MWPVIMGFVRAYAPVILLPATVTIGAIGYSLEWFVKKGVDQAKDQPSISEKRDERLLEELLSDKKDDKPSSSKRRTIFDKN